jgi:hypothetical protein
MILLAILCPGDDVYVVPLSRELSIVRGREVSVGSVHDALGRLELNDLCCVPSRGIGVSTCKAGQSGIFA